MRFWYPLPAAAATPPELLLPGALDNDHLEIQPPEAHIARATRTDCITISSQQPYFTALRFHKKITLKDVPNN